MAVNFLNNTSSPSQTEVLPLPKDLTYEFREHRLALYHRQLPVQLLPSADIVLGLRGQEDPVIFASFSMSPFISLSNFEQVLADAFREVAEEEVEV
jgi:hypothetical protein